MIRYIRDIQAHRKGVELEPGFTLIELLIVIVVLGILAATVIFALGGVTSQSAQAACQSDGKSYEVAVAAFENAPANTANTPPTKTSELTGTSVAPDPNYGSMLHQASNNPHFFVLLSGDAGAPAGAVAGHVYVGKTAAGAVDYDTQTAAAGDGCFGVS
jgi:general secretion pathway protein G